MGVACLLASQELVARGLLRYAVTLVKVKLLSALASSLICFDDLGVTRFINR